MNVNQLREAVESTAKKLAGLREMQNEHMSALDAVRVRLGTASAEEIGPGVEESRRLTAELQALAEAIRHASDVADKAAEAYGVARLPEIRREQESTFRAIVETFSTTARKAGDRAEEIVRLEGEAAALRLRPGQTSDPNPAFAFENGVIRAALDSALSGGAASVVEVRMIRGQLSSPEAVPGCGRKHLAAGEHVTVSPSVADALCAQGIAEKV